VARYPPAGRERRKDVDIDRDRDRAQASSPIFADLVSSSPYPRPDRILELAIGAEARCNPLRSK
jgi:hypothetical protein